MHKHWIQIVTTMICLAFFVFLAVGSGDQDQKTSEVKKEEAAIQISAKQLYADYDSNEVAADEKYKGKILEVSGTVNDIAKDITDTIYVTLKGAEYFGDVQCFFSNEFTKEAAKLSKGQQLTVKGECDGKMMNVLLKGCVIVK
jgi:hypothetical protein